METIWKAVVGYEGVYEVSNEGQVRLLPSKKKGKDGKIYKTRPHMMRIDTTGQVILSKDGKYRNHPVRSLVGEAFLNISYGCDITHLDGDMLNASVSNIVPTEEFRKMDDNWRDIPGFEGSYQVSRFGEVRSLDRYVNSSNGGLKFCKGVIREQEISKDGYYQVALYSHGKTATKANSHTYVAKAFIPNPENKPTVNHIDGNKLNNCVENLEWATYSEQQEHARRTGLRKKSYWTPEQGLPGGDWNKSRMIRVRCIETGEEFESYSAAGEAVGASAFQIKMSVEKHKIACGFHFVKADEPDYDFGIADLDGEVWYDIPGYENLYQISNKSRVKSLYRKVEYKDGRTRSVPEKILANTDCKFSLNKDNSAHIFKLSELKNMIPQLSTTHKLFKI